MVEERKIVLDLLEKGTISKEEAFKLLEALDKAKDDGFDINEELKKLRDSADKFFTIAKEKVKEAEPKVQSSARQAKNKAKDIFRTLREKKEGKPNEEDIFEHDYFLEDKSDKENEQEK